MPKTERHFFFFFGSEMFIFLQNTVGFNTKSANYAISNVSNFGCQVSKTYVKFWKNIMPFAQKTVAQKNWKTSF